MRILFLTQIVPYPPDAGPKVKTWNVLRYLFGCGYEIILVTFARDEEIGNLEPLKDYCKQIHTIPLQRSRWLDIYYLMYSYLNGRPFLVERDNRIAMRKKVNEILASEEIDVIHADQLTMTQFALPKKPQKGYKRSLSVYDAHNAVWKILRRMTENVPIYLRPFVANESQKVKRYTGHIIKSYNQILAVTDLDKTALLETMTCQAPVTENEKSKISVIPIAIDTQKLQPVQRNPNSLNILTLGTMHYPPNADGIRWFAYEVFPTISEQVHDVTLTIVGKNPPKDIQDLAINKPRQIQVTGYVPDLEPYFEKAAVNVVPVRSGGGMRVRILEAFARGIPVVTTSVGLEGIDAIVGESVMIADTAQGFAKAVIQVLNNKQLREKLAYNARCLVELRYDWQKTLAALGQIYESMAATLETLN